MYRLMHAAYEIKMYQSRIEKVSEPKHLHLLSQCERGKTLCLVKLRSELYLPQALTTTAEKQNARESPC